MRAILILTVVLLIFSGCTASNDGAGDKTEEATDKKITVSAEEFESGDFDIYFASGVNGDNVIYGDSQNYISIIGFLGDHIKASQVSIITDMGENRGLVHTTASVDENNQFYLRTNMGSGKEYEMILSLDESVSIPMVKDPESFLEKGYLLDYKPNVFTEGGTEKDNGKENNSKDREEETSTESDSNKVDNIETTVGDYITFTSGVKITIDSVELTNEKPNGEIKHNFVRVDFTIDNQSSEQQDVSAHIFSLYDSDRNKAELNAKNFYNEEIAPGMKSSGSAYFDSISKNPFTVMVGDGVWKSE